VRPPHGSLFLFVPPHFNSNGTFTQGHHQTNPNNTQFDNYNTRGNYNPSQARTVRARLDN